jgi:hypothetical protein
MNCLLPKAKFVQLYRTLGRTSYADGGGKDRISLKRCKMCRIPALNSAGIYPDFMPFLLLEDLVQ